MAPGISRSILVGIFSLAACSAFAQAAGGFRGGVVTPSRMPYPGGGTPGVNRPPASLAAPGFAAPGLAAPGFTTPALGSSPGEAASYSGAAGRGGPQQYTAKDAIAAVQADLDSSRGDDIYSLPVVEKLRRAGGQ
jgi:hypothetical protein